MAKHSKINLFTGKLVSHIYYNLKNWKYFLFDQWPKTNNISNDHGRQAKDREWFAENLMLTWLLCPVLDPALAWRGGGVSSQPTKGGMRKLFAIICIFRGFLNCLSADGSVYDTTKYCWLQGRWDRTKVYPGGILNWWKYMIGVWYKFQASLLIWFNEKIITICALISLIKWL